ncbi:hypothetical protein BV898_12761 [Hypsibius exemplaris]|uniref:Uncharacterized protein n=1 Tax=Hypsibius exemplaris TaxID=2072580 RepID=A0A1W0WCR5_HYPEX|nr:hypothetical protein BV898_12761 [Hypsibius exemplaris]
MILTSHRRNNCNHNYYHLEHQFRSSRLQYHHQTSVHLIHLAAQQRSRYHVLWREGPHFGSVWKNIRRTSQRVRCLALDGSHPQFEAPSMWRYHPQ